MTEKAKWRASGVELLTTGIPLRTLGYRVRPIGECRWCGDETEAGDDPYPDLCAMCAKANRTSVNQ